MKWDGRPLWGAGVLIFFLGFLPFLPAVASGYFLQDDFYWISLYHDKSGPELFSIFANQWSGDYENRQIRPLAGVSYTLDYALWRLDPRGFHLFNAGLHAWNGVLVFLLTWLLLQEMAPALLAGVLFAINPVHAEVGFWMSARSDSIAAFLVLSAVVCFVRYLHSARMAWYLASLTLYGLSLFGKESAIPLPLFLCLFLIPALAPQRRLSWTETARSLVPFFLVLAVYAAVRFVAFGAFVAYGTLAPVPPRPLGIVGMLKHRAKDFAWVLLPTVKPLFRRGLVELAAVTGAACAVWLGWVFLPGCRQRKLLSSPLTCLMVFGGCWYAAFMVPVFVLGTWADRYLYLPSAGLAMLLAAVFVEGYRIRPAPGRRILAACVTFYLLLNVVGLLDADQRWIRDSEVSRRMHSGLIRLGQTVAKGSTIVFLHTPPPEEELMWSWALRSALRPPFTSIYEDHRILEGPDNFVNPEEWWTSNGIPARWWHSKRPIVRDLLAGSFPVSVAFWDERQRDLATITLDNDILAPYRQQREEILRSEYTALEFLSSLETRARVLNNRQLVRTP